MAFRIRLEKENFKFSCSHFTIFGPANAEALHGHNYYVSAEVSLSELDPDLGFAFDFNLLKPVIKNLAQSLDERVLLPTRSPFLKVEKSKDSVRAVFNQKTYDIPAGDVVLLDLVNITSEELARYFANEVVRVLKKSGQPEFKRVTALTLGIEETRGQIVFFDVDL